MDLTPKQQMSIIWLRLPPSPMTVVHEDMLRELASLRIIEYDPATADVKFTPHGEDVYRDLTQTRRPPSR